MAKPNEMSGASDINERHAAWRGGKKSIVTESRNKGERSRPRDDCGEGILWRQAKKTINHQTGAKKRHQSVLLAKKRNNSSTR